MHKINKNQLLELHFNEAGKREADRVREHVAECGECAACLKELREIDQQLQRWQDEMPESSTFAAITGRIEEIPPPVIENPAPVSLFSLAGLSAVFVALVVFIVLFREKISSLPLFNGLKEFWLVQSFGSLGITICLICLIGIFMTLSLTPILFQESRLRNMEFYNYS